MKTRTVFPYLGIGARSQHPSDCAICGSALHAYLSPRHEYVRFADLVPERDVTETIENRQEQIRRSIV